jgi:hypothetical protein
MPLQPAVIYYRYAILLRANKLMNYCKQPLLIHLVVTAILANGAMCQDKSANSNLEIVVPHSALKPEVKKYEFTVKLWPSAGDSRQAELIVRCSPTPGLSCSPEKQKVSLSDPKLSPITARVEDELNAAEIDADLHINDGTALTASRSLDFGLWNSMTNVGNDFPLDFVGGSPRGAHLWLEGANGAKLKPTTTIQIDVRSRDGCAEVKKVNQNEDERSVQFGPIASINIAAWHEKTSGTVWVNPGLWSKSDCSLDLVLKSGNEEKQWKTIQLSIKPNYGPAFLMCLLGALAQYFVANLVQIVLATRAKEKVVLRELFIGPNGVEIIETLLKGTLAYLISYLLNTTEIIQFKGADKSSLLGFAIIGFLIGFWQLKPLWDAIRKLSNPRETRQSKDSESLDKAPTG